MYKVNLKLLLLWIIVIVYTNRQTIVSKRLKCMLFVSRALLNISLQFQVRRMFNLKFICVFKSMVYYSKKISSSEHIEKIRCLKILYEHNIQITHHIIYKHKYMLDSVVNNKFFMRSMTHLILCKLFDINGIQ